MTRLLWFLTYCLGVFLAVFVLLFLAISAFVMAGVCRMAGTITHCFSFGGAAVILTSPSLWVLSGGKRQ